jgi:hypothetical protein
MLSAIVLWDELQVISTKPTNPQIGFTAHKERLLREDPEGAFGKRYPLIKSIIKEFSFDAALSKFLSSVEADLTEMLEEEELRQIDDIIHRAPHVPEYFSFMDSKNPFPRARETFLRTFLYSVISYSKGTSYLPHPIRADLISRYNLLDRFYEKIMDDRYDSDNRYNRMILLNPVNKEIREYYEYINQLAEDTVFVCKYPLLYDFIRRNASDMNEELAVAIDIRNEPDVVLFRKYLSSLDAKVNEKDFGALTLALEQIKDLAKQITSKYNRKPKLGKWELKVGREEVLEFVLNRILDIPEAIKRLKNRRNLTFVSRLIDFGIRGKL